MSHCILGIQSGFPEGLIQTSLERLNGVDVNNFFKFQSEYSAKKGPEIHQVFTIGGEFTTSLFPPSYLCPME